MSIDVLDEKLLRGLGYQFLRYGLGRKWLNQDFIFSYLEYCHGFIKNTI
jgi:hypothetical protein